MSDMIVELEGRVRVRAYFLWEREGRPHGRAEAHWHRAAEAEAAALRRVHEAPQAQERAANGATATATPSRTGAAVVPRRATVRVGATGDAASPPARNLPEQPDPHASPGAARPEGTAKRRKTDATPRAPRRK
jgi:hypothetical protein